MKTSSISFRLIVGCILATLLPLVIIGVVSNYKSSNALRQMSAENLAGSAEELASSMDTVLYEEMKIAKMISHDVAIQDMASGHKLDMPEAYLKLLSKKTFVKLENVFEGLGKQYMGIFITDVNGYMYTGVLENGLEYKGVTLSNQQYYIDAKATGKVTISDIYKSTVTGDPILVVCAPVEGKDGVFAGVIGLSIKAEIFTELIRNKTVGSSGYAYMINKNGLIIAHRNEELELKLDATTIPEMASINKAMMAGETGTLNYVFKGDTKMAGYAPVSLNGWSIAVTQKENDYLSASYSIRNFTILIAILSQIVVTIFVFFLARSIVSPIKDAVDSLKDIAEGDGDLTMRLNVKGKDEVAELATWFNVFIEKLQKIIGQLSNNSNFINENSGKLNNVSDELLSLTEDSAQKTSLVAAASEEMSANLNTVAAAMEQSATNVNMVAAASEEMSATINEIAENAERARSVSSGAVGQADLASEKMNELGGAAEKIGRVTETITEISEQTNLLALNATIEAARAGEAGKGFAVVANEIKDLAKQTADATKDIKTLIEDVQVTTRSAGDEIVEISRVIGSVNDIVGTIATAVEEQTATTSEINQNISQASQGMQEVNESVSQSSAVSAEITRDIHEVAISGNSVANNSSEVKNTAEKLNKTSEDLAQIVSIFKI
ncbi:MAG: methyl-accepting chemotaxis protein [Desulfotalea sp.]